MDDNLIASAAITIDAPAADVWSALVDPAAIKQFMFDTNVVSDWQTGSSIVWKGEWQGNKYEDHGEVLEARPPSLLRYTHFSPMMGLPDVPENYHTITIELDEVGDKTRVTLTQDNNRTEEARHHSTENWEMMLAGLKRTVEG